MFWIWVITMPMAAFAGAGMKWAVDRVWPPPPQVIEVPPEPRPQGGGPRLTTLDDTMDVLAAGVDVGMKIGRHRQRWPESEPPSVLEQLGVQAGVPLPATGWVSGPCLNAPVDGWAGLS